MLSLCHATEQEPAIIIRPEFVRIGGDLVVGSLLSKIYYWCVVPDKSGNSKMRVKRGDHYWVAKTREGWMEECGLSLEQYKRALSVLKQKHLIEVKVMIFGGLAISHVRLLTEALDALRGKDTNRVESYPPTGWSVIRHPSTRSNTRKTDIGSCADARPRTEPTVKAIDILKKKEEPHTSSLPSYWQKRCSAVFGGYQKPLTMKQMGQLKMLQKYLGPRTRDVIDYALNHWVKFSHIAGIEEGGLSPSDPHIGFLLKHHAVVVNMLWPTPAPMQSIAPAPQKPEYHESVAEEKPDKLKQQELLKAMLADFK